MKKKIVVIGGGFAGLYLINTLNKSGDFDIILVDKNNYNFFPPLIYQVGAGIIEPSSISYPFRKLLRKKENVHFRLGELLKVIPEENKIILSNGEMNYDFLVFATGTQSNFFGMKNIEEKSSPMKTMEDALNLRGMIIRKLEEASITSNPEELEKLLTMAVIGGGPAGVEICGVLCELMNHVIPKEYPEFKSRVKVHLIEGSPNLLGPMSETAHKISYKNLKEMGINIKLNARVKDYVNDEVILEGDEPIKTKTVIWTAGVTSMFFDGIPQEVYGRGRRMQVDEFNKVIGLDNIYALGDTCIQITDSKYPDGHPQLAQVAIQQGSNLGKNFSKILRNEKLNSFSYFDKGTMAVIGRNKAVADLVIPFKANLSGFIAWFIWGIVHLMSLSSLGNRSQTLYRWATTYISRNTSLRMIYKDYAKNTSK